MRTNTESKVNPKDYSPTRKRLVLKPGEMLREIRRLQSLSQKQLSDQTGIPQSHISALENGRRKMGRDIAISVAMALKVHPSVILFSDLDKTVCTNAGRSQRVAAPSTNPKI